MDTTGTPQAPWRAVTTDISRSGIGLRTRRIVVPGRRVLITLRIPGGQAKFLHGEVRHASYESAGAYRVGVEFEAMPGTDEVRYWVAARSLEASEG
jgi:c-di-GMP-binding flagellar brake protein YcgR